MLGRLQRRLERILKTANMSTRRPHLNAHRESNIRGLYVIGDLAGAPVIKLAMEQGIEVIDHILRQPGTRPNDPNVYDVIIVGAGAAGLNAALAAQDNSLRCLVLEKNKIANDRFRIQQREPVRRHSLSSCELPDAGEFRSGDSRWRRGSTEPFVARRGYRREKRGRRPARAAAGSGIPRRSGTVPRRTTGSAAWLSGRLDAL